MQLIDLNVISRVIHSVVTTRTLHGHYEEKTLTDIKLTVTRLTRTTLTRSDIDSQTAVN